MPHGEQNPLAESGRASPVRRCPWPGDSLCPSLADPTDDQRASLWSQCSRSHTGANFGTLGFQSTVIVPVRSGPIQRDWEDPVAQKVVDWNENFKASLFFVSYSGQGKYGDRSVAIPWSMLPENDEKNPNDWQIDLPAEASGESSWWPTIHVWLPGDHNSTNEYHWIETAGGTILVVVCVYQWLWPMPQGWSVRLANWSRL